MKSGARWWPGRGVEEGMWMRVRRAEKVLTAEARRVARQRGVFGANVAAALATGTLNPLRVRSPVGIQQHGKGRAVVALGNQNGGP